MVARAIVRSQALARNMQGVGTPANARHIPSKCLACSRYGLGSCSTPVCHMLDTCLAHVICLAFALCVPRVPDLFRGFQGISAMAFPRHCPGTLIRQDDLPRCIVILILVGRLQVPASSEVTQDISDVAAVRGVAVPSGLSTESSAASPKKTGAAPSAS